MAALIISGLALTAATVALVVILMQRRSLCTLIQEVKNLETKLQEYQSVTPQGNRFATQLTQAEKKQQQSDQELKEKLEENRAVKPQGQADKYRYAVALAAQGQDVDSIAKALNMASSEVAQVVRLAQVKR